MKTKYTDCVRLFSVRAGKNRGYMAQVEVREGCYEVTRAGVEKQNPPKDQRETSRALDGRGESQIIAVNSEEEEGEDTQRETKQCFSKC